MIRANENALREQSVVTAITYTNKHTALPESFGKWLAIWQYTQGFSSLEATQAAFDSHPSWRSA